LALHAFASLVIIKVDIDFPERNREVTIYKIDDLEGKDDELYHGYFGFFRFDAGLVEDDPHFEHVKLSIYSGTQLVIEMPALPRPFQTNADRDTFALDDFVSVNMLKAMDIKRNKHLKDAKQDRGAKQERRWKRLCLQFPDDHQLSSKELEGDHEENEVPFELVEDESGNSWILFKVITNHIEGNKAGKSMDQVTKKMSKLALKKNKNKPQGTQKKDDAMTD